MEIICKAKYKHYKYTIIIVNSSQIPTQSMKESIILIWGENCKKCKFCCKSGHWYNVWPQYKVWLSSPQFFTCQKANKSIYLDDGCNSLKQIAFAIAHILKLKIMYLERVIFSKSLSNVGVYVLFSKLGKSAYKSAGSWYLNLTLYLGQEKVNFKVTMQKSFCRFVYWSAQI